MEVRIEGYEKWRGIEIEGINKFIRVYNIKIIIIY
jgi:hypothetical protein